MATTGGRTLTDLEEKLLLTIWKMGGIGKMTVERELLKAKLGPEDNDWLTALTNLHELCFVKAKDSDSKKHVSLTPLGLAVLRQIEEDQLQELE